VALVLGVHALGDAGPRRDDVLVHHQGRQVAGHLDLPGHERHLGVDLALGDPGVDQQVADPAPGDGQTARRRRATAADLGRNEGQAHLLGRGVVHADRVDFQQRQGIGCGEGRPGGLAARLLLLVRQEVGGGEGHELQRLAAGVNVEHQIGERQQPALKIVGDLFRDRAVGATGKAAVEVAAVEGGGAPAWAHSGRELFYRSGQGLMAVAVVTTPTFAPGQEKALFSVAEYLIADTRSEYDMTADDQRFVMIRDEEAQVKGDLVIVQNFFEELKQRAPN